MLNNFSWVPFWLFNNDEKVGGGDCKRGGGGGGFLSTYTVNTYTVSMY